MHLKIGVEGCTVTIKADFRNGLAGDATWTFQTTCSDKFYAGLAAEALTYQLGRAIYNAREDAYNEGYAAGRAKKKRQDWFSSSL